MNEVQCRLLAVQTSLLDALPAPSRSVFPKIPCRRTPIAELIEEAEHILDRDRRGFHCMMCFERPPSKGSLRKWLRAPCCPSNPSKGHHQATQQSFRKCVLDGNRDAIALLRRLDPSHTLEYRAGTWMCTACGCCSQHLRRRLADLCCKFATKGAANQLSRWTRGLMP